MIHNGNSKRQIDFLPEQKHVKAFEMAMLGIAVLCVIVVLVIVLATDIGNTFRPTA